MSTDLPLSPTSPVLAFFEGLLSEGHVRLVTSEFPSPEELDRATDFVISVESSWRDHCPGTPPAVDRAVVNWAVTMFYRSAQLLVYRELGEESVQQDLSLPAPDALVPANIYSVDLVFRFMPDLWRIAKAASEGDPLVKQLESWGRDWPLSSVAMKLPIQDRLSGILQQPSLLNLFIDRILEKEAFHLLETPAVRQRVTALLQTFPKLSPAAGRALRELETLSKSSPPQSTAAEAESVDYNRLKGS